MRTVILDNYARLFCRKRFYPVHRALLSLAARGMGLFNSKDMKLSGEVHFFEHVTSSDEFAVIFDVGANVGDFASGVLSANKNARVFAFEPHPRTFETLRKVAERNSRLEVFRCALGAEPSTATLYDVASNDGSALASLHRAALEMKTKSLTEHEIEIRSLDSVLATTKVDRIDLLKIDTEGHEREVLAGASLALAQGRVRSVLFEFNEMNVFSRTFMHDFVRLLEGFKFYRLLPDGLAAIDPYSSLHSELYGFQNIFAVRNDLHAALSL